MRVTSLLAATLLIACSHASGDIGVEIDWSIVKTTTSTAATIEVDVMPFLGRTTYGGPFNGYYQALSNLGAEFVRYAPWFPNPRVVVPELVPSDCTATEPATNWNSTYFDGIIRDFMAAVCGPNAVSGACKKSVVQQLSTMPGWLYVGGMKESDLPAYPWNTTDPFSAYSAGNSLVEKSCGSLARHFARIVGHYTAGGHHDECGHWHPSGFNYSWWGVSVLNEDEHHIAPDNGEAYTMCYDAIKTEVTKVNPKVVLVGPEICCRGTDYLEYFLNESNHADGKAPEVASYHQAMTAGGTSSADFFTQWDGIYNDYVMKIEAFLEKTGRKTQMVLNEYIPFVTDWCEPSSMDSNGGCPNWQDPAASGGDPNLQHMKGVGMNKETVAWNAAAGVFAYGYGTLAELGYKFVGQDQLIGGTWPDNEPAVTCLDWQTGQPNAKYWVTNLLATTVGDSQPKQIVAYNLTGKASAVRPGQTADGNCGGTHYESDCKTVSSGAWNITQHGIKNLDDCVAKAKQCGQNGNYVSFSTINHDCSWYAHCSMDDLASTGAGYTNYKSCAINPQPGDVHLREMLYVMPYIKGGKKGILLVNKQNNAIDVYLAGLTGGDATVVEATGATPGLNPAVAKQIGKDGVLALAPFGVAVVTTVETAADSNSDS